MATPSPLMPPELQALLAAKELERKKLEWAQWVSSEYIKCKNARQPFERQWFINLAFLSGRQYVTPLEVPTHGFRLTTPKSPPWRVRLVVNKIRPAVRTECAKLTTSKPIPTVVPATNESEDFNAAAIAEQILKTQFATAEFESTYRSWIWWGVVCGTSFLKQYYDPSKLDYHHQSVPTFPDGQAIPQDLISSLPPEVQQKLTSPQPAQGKICVERISPFHIFVPDLLSESIEDQPYVMHVMTKSPLWVEDKYGFKPTADARAANTVLDAAHIISRGTEDHMDSVLVKEVWIKPNGHKDFPEGGVLTVINDKVVQHRPKWPYPFNEYPFYKYSGVPTGGFYSDSIIVDLIPIQKEYNKKRSQMIEIVNTMGKPKLLYQKGSINPKMISSEPGQSIPYTPGYEAPIPMQGVEVPASFVQELTQLTTEFDDISGQHEISRGQTSLSSLTSGTAIAYLQEQDDAKLNYQVASIENACELLGKHNLYMASNYWDDNRLVRVTGKNDQFEALSWKKGMLKGNCDVKVQTGSALPFSKAARQALITEMMQNGFVDPQAGLEVMNFGGLEKVLDEALVDKRQAMRENMKMMDIPESMLRLLLEPAPGPNGESPITQPDPRDPTGQKTIQFNGDGTPFQPQPPVPVNSWDNDEEHIHWHNHFRKSQEFELLSSLHKKAFEMHVQLHMMKLQAQMVNSQNQVIQTPELGGPATPSDSGYPQDEPTGGGNPEEQEPPQE